MKTKNPVGRPRVDKPKSERIRISRVLFEELKKIGVPRELVENACEKEYKIKSESE